jgi:hypothetical protein
MSTSRGLIRVVMTLILVYIAYKIGQNHGKQLKK